MPPPAVQVSKTKPSARLRIGPMTTLITTISMSASSRTHRPGLAVAVAEDEQRRNEAAQDERDEYGGDPLDRTPFSPIRLNILHHDLRQPNRNIATAWRG